MIEAQKSTSINNVVEQLFQKKTTFYIRIEHFLKETSQIIGKKYFRYVKSFVEVCLII